MKQLTLLLCITALVTASCQNAKQYPELTEDGVYAEFVTNKGTFVAKLYHDKTPVTVANFVSLAQGTNTMTDSMYTGKPFYNGLTFHRVMKDFMIQGGDPLATGMGTPGYRFPDEFVEGLIHDRKGLLSMANGGPNSNGSQFFVTLVPTPWLDYKHSVFGEIVMGQEVVDSIGLVPVNKQNNKPIEDVIMQEVNIINKGDINVPNLKEALANQEQEQTEMANKAQEFAAEAKKELEAALEQAETLPSGLEIAYVTKGDGPKPTEGQTIQVDYEGYFTEGMLFDSSDVTLTDKFNVTNLARKAADAYQPIKTVLSKDMQLVAGFKEAMFNMSVGDEIVVKIPPHLGYGERGMGPIPPNTPLIFRMRMLSAE